MKKILCLWLLSVVVLQLAAQNPAVYPFADEISHFKQYDDTHPPVKGQILFVGSSSFRKWTNVQNAFPDYHIINRGFGGSTLPDVIHYANDIIFPYDAKQIVIYCGENDIASSDTITAEMVAARYKELFQLIRSHQKKVVIDFVSIKPSPSRAHFRPVVEKANLLIQAFISKQKNARFINIYTAMLHADGSMRKELFVEDNLHMNSEGYAIWQRIIQPYLLK